jgi:hypothetical protein
LHQKRRAATSPPLAQELIAQTLGIPQPVVKSAADFFIEPVLPRPPNHLDRHPIIRGVVHPLAKLNSDPLTISQKTDTHLMRIGCCLTRPENPLYLRFCGRMLLQLLNHQEVSGLFPKVADFTQIGNNSCQLSFILATGFAIRQIL